MISMRITNHNVKNSYDVNTYVMRGTITMTRKEYQKAFKWLQSEYSKAIENCETYKRDSLCSLHDVKGDGVVSLGVYASQMIAKKYGLKGYKNHNYGIKII